ncbi:transposase [Marinicellulosiphila megalodicopiae]|uniref:transposase n=1 Tax=Marinicellulosiphila megalodicopiae TaxID=2724896 RepID=UPI003BAE79B4
MAVKRSAQIDLSVTSMYSCCTRSVRKAFILNSKKGIDRRKWIEDRILFLTTIFSIDVCAYSVMSNHYHVALNVHQSIAKSWSKLEVLTRWSKIYKGTELSRRYLNGDNLSEIELDIVDDFAEICREKLFDISWFMRNINEPLARIANKEDGCTGRFWESRFKSQALLDEKALLTCMAYIDLNPIRAGLNDELKNSDFTSIKLRINKAKKVKNPNHINQQEKRLSKLTGGYSDSKKNDIPIKLTSYFELVEWTGKQIRKDKKGYLQKDSPKILEELSIDAYEFVNAAQYFESKFHRLIGCVENIYSAMKVLNLKKSKGSKFAMSLFGS